VVVFFIFISIETREYLFRSKRENIFAPTLCDNIIYLKRARKNGSSSDGKHESFLIGARVCRRSRRSVVVFFIFISIETREYLFRSKRENDGESCGCAFPLSLSLALSLSCAPFVFIDETREIERAFFLFIENINLSREGRREHQSSHLFLACRPVFSTTFFNCN